MTTNELWTLGIAGYAAVISTFVLGWDAYKWLHAGPKVTIEVSPGMKVIGDGQDREKNYVSVIAVNRGDRATTITNLGFVYYSSWLKAFFRRKNDKAFIITTPSEAQVIPYRFEAGAQWIGLANQNDEVTEMMRNGYLYAVLYHSHAGRGVRRRVYFQPS